MSYLDLYVSPPTVFGGSLRKFKEADYVVVGVPFDATSSYRSGSRFAPLAVRETSLNIETYSFRANIDLEELKIHDAGDLHVTGDLNETLKRLGFVTEEILCQSKMPVFIGGEHTITLGTTRALRKDSTVLCFDAHLDLRNEYMDQAICHATVMRRIHETGKPKKIVEVGVRAVCNEEVEYAKDQGITYLTSNQIVQTGVEETAKQIKRLLTGCNQVYLTVDMDVLDPAFAPAVQNPESEGLSTCMLLDLLNKICDNRVAAFDVVEVTPHYDTGATSILAARIIFEILSYTYRSKSLS